MIRAPRDQRPFDGSPGLIAVFHALRRLLAPRHPPHALSSLAALVPSSAGRPRHRETETARQATPRLHAGGVTILLSLRALQSLTIHSAGVACATPTALL